MCKRKPEPVCAQFNDSGCALSGVMMKVEFESGAKHHVGLKYMDKAGTYNAAMTVRLAEPWANANGLVYGDARFTSVKAAYHQMAELDVDSLGDLKTGSALFPRKELSRLVAKEHGSIAGMTASMKLPSGATFPLYAIGQRRGPAVHTFLTKARA